MSTRSCPEPWADPVMPRSHEQLLKLFPVQHTLYRFKSLVIAVLEDGRIGCAIVRASTMQVLCR